MMYSVTKTYGNERGFSCTFRQHRADSHCNMLHGYALGFELVFASENLDSRNWVIDFGNLKDVEKWLKSQFDHTTVIAHDDPLISTFRELDQANVIDLIILDNVGCEAFAKHVADYIQMRLPLMCDNGAELVSVKVFEHSANAATYYPGGFCYGN